MVSQRQIIETSDCSTESFKYLSLFEELLFCPLKKVEIDFTCLSPRNKAAYCSSLQNNY